MPCWAHFLNIRHLKGTCATGAFFHLHSIGINVTSSVPKKSTKRKSKNPPAVPQALQTIFNKFINFTTQKGAGRVVSGGMERDFLYGIQGQVD